MGQEWRSVHRRRGQSLAESRTSFTVENSSSVLLRRISGSAYRSAMSHEPTLDDTSRTVPGSSRSSRIPSTSCSRGVFLMRTFT